MRLERDWGGNTKKKKKITTEIEQNTISLRDR